MARARACVVRPRLQLLLHQALAHPPTLIWSSTLQNVKRVETRPAPAAPATGAKPAAAAPTSGPKPVAKPAGLAKKTVKVSCEAELLTCVAAKRPCCLVQSTWQLLAVLLLMLLSLSIAVHYSF